LYVRTVHLKEGRFRSGIIQCVFLIVVVAENMIKICLSQIMCEAKLFSNKLVLAVGCDQSPDVSDVNEKNWLRPLKTSIFS
jgi:hypothetical protein